MYLKKIEIQGFKSFPEYTLIEFSQGMTAVVGPNGSGKSNVTDAIRWVLGEQSAKNLRGGKMEDVIFNGTQSRKAMNYAEVSITLDNSDHFVDVEYDELQITRRLYRSGESEYQINHVNCRLKDIVRLFLDTGIGKDGYSIVGQGRVDDVLSTKSEDRRKIIEEASGIVRYKSSKEEAERKLASTNQNLVRIDDMIAGLSERLEPLKEQAKKATEYHSAYEQMKQKDIALLVRRINDANKAMGDSSSVKQQLEEEIRTQEDRYVELRKTNSTLTGRSEELENLIEDKRQELSDLSENMHDTGSDIKINTELIRQLNQKITQSGENDEEINRDIDRLRADYDKNIKESDLLLDQANEHKKSAQRLLEEREALLEEYRSSELNQDSIRNNIDSKTGELADTNNRIASSRVKLESLKSRLDELTNIKKNAASLSDELGRELQAADLHWHKMIEQEGEVTSDIETAKEKLTKATTRFREINADFEKENRIFLSEKARLKTLTDLENRKEGYQESVRRLLNEARTDAQVSRAIVGIIGELISTDKKYETALEIALGASIHNVVTNKEEDAAFLIDILKRKKLGRVTFLPIENIRPRTIERNVIASARTVKGYIGIASELIECPGNISDIISNLLGRIIICEDMDSARSIASRTDHTLKVITLEGDCINPGGSLTGGSIRKDSAGILGRAREIETIREKLADTETRLSGFDAERQELDDAIAELNNDIVLLNEQQKCFAMERVKAESEYRNIESRREQIAAEIKNAVTNIEQISASKIKLEDDLEELLLISQETENELADFREDIARTDNISREYNARLDELRERISAEQTASERVLAERNGKMSLAGHIKEEIGRRLEQLRASKSEREEANAKIEEYQRLNSGLEETLSALKQQFEDIRGEVNALTEQKNSADKEMQGLITRLSDINDTLNALRDKYNGLVTKYERYINDIDFSKNRLWEDYETTFDNVRELYPEVENITETAKEISVLKNKIKALGPVNLNSIDEYKEVNERYEFMTEQRNDIVASKENLEKVISDLINEMQEQFINQFTIINENFKKVFADLFNGGSAEIVLENEEDVLNCNIEIKAQPPGKKLQSLTLLSGGERCLTAIALLFAILQLKPSPFVILDEVEAALDDVNVNTFADFVNRYSARSQFIVVTHRKGTMEACDRMYGVTMQERGISKILSMRIQ